MLVINKSQMEALGQAARRRFEDRMVEHLGEFAPALARAAGEEHLRKAIHLGISRAGRYGLTHQGPVRLYLELMLLFGSDFDTDPQYTWAASILGHADPGPQMQLAERLYEKTLDYQAQALGSQDDPTAGVLRDIRFLSHLPLPSHTETDFLAGMRRELTRAYPRRAAYVGEEGLGALIRQGLQAAPGLRLSSEQGTVLLVALMVVFGHGCLEDPLHPWLARTLKETELSDNEARVRSLKGQALAMLERMLAQQRKETRS